MERVLGGLAVIAVTLLATAIFMGAGPFGDRDWAAAALQGSRVSLDMTSFVVGVLTGLFIVWLVRVPWAAIPGQIITAILGWQRNAAFMAIAIVSASVLLFY